MVGRGGWLRLPQEFLERAGIGDAGRSRRSRTTGSSSARRAETACGPSRSSRRSSRRRPARRSPILRGVVKTHGHGATAAHVFAGLDAESSRAAA